MKIKLNYLKIKTMKLALMALAIEISLVRMFVGSWGWAVVIVLLYCISVYARQILIVNKPKRNKFKIEEKVEDEYSLIQVV
jgi:low affinity Fe/Cu permease